MLALSPVRTWPLWDWFFPPLCAVCGRTLDPRAILFCAQCWADAPVADVADFHKLHHVDRVASGFRFSGDAVIRRSVHALKYENAKPLAHIMAQRLIPRLPLRFVEEDMVWAEVPLHWRRQLIRGYNQSRWLARELANATYHSPPISLLRRVRYTPTQTARTYRERIQNVKNAFASNPKVKLPKSVLLIDDVITSGATMDECARTLKESGVEWVGAFSFALAHPS
jgi:ComF family protein